MLCTHKSQWGNLRCLVLASICSLQLRERVSISSSCAVNEFPWKLVESGVLFYAVNYTPMLSLIGVVLGIPLSPEAHYIKVGTSNPLLVLLLLDSLFLFPSPSPLLAPTHHLSLITCAPSPSARDPSTIARAPSLSASCSQATPRLMTSHAQARPHASPASCCVFAWACRSASQLSKPPNCLYAFNDDLIFGLGFWDLVIPWWWWFGKGVEPSLKCNREFLSIF